MKFLDAVAKRLNIHTQQKFPLTAKYIHSNTDWYHVTSRQVISLGGIGVLRCYGGSLVKGDFLYYAYLSKLLQQFILSMNGSTTHFICHIRGIAVLKLSVSEYLKINLFILMHCVI